MLVHLLYLALGLVLVGVGVAITIQAELGVAPYDVLTTGLVALTDIPIGKADDEAAFAAMKDVESRGWFVREKEEEFAFFYYWDTPSEMKEWIDAEWDDFEKIEDDVYRKAQSIWASANADARVRVRVKMLITRWRSM